MPGKSRCLISAPFSWKAVKLEYARHKRKLRLGALKGNAFTLVLCEISDRRDVETRLQAIRDGGVPNYFGAQIRHWRQQLAGRAALGEVRRCAIAQTQFLVVGGT